MNKYLATYAATALVLFMLDVLWIGGLAKSMYQEGIGHLMAEQPRLGVAALFYALYPVGLLVFVVAPRGVTDGWSVTLMHAALFGLVAYATYDLTNLATAGQWVWRYWTWHGDVWRAAQPLRQASWRFSVLHKNIGWRPPNKRNKLLKT